MQNEVWGWDLNSLHPTTVHWKIFTNSYMKLSPSTVCQVVVMLNTHDWKRGGGWKNSPIPMLFILAWEWNYIWILFVSIPTLTNTPSQSHLHTCTHPHNHIFTHAHTLTITSSHMHTLSHFTYIAGAQSGGRTATLCWCVEKESVE